MKKRNLFVLLLLGLLAAIGLGAAGCEPFVKVEVQQQMEKGAAGADDEAGDEDAALYPDMP